MSDPHGHRSCLHSGDTSHHHVHLMVISDYLVTSQLLCPGKPCFYLKITEELETINSKQPDSIVCSIGTWQNTEFGKHSRNTFSSWAVLGHFSPKAICLTEGRFIHTVIGSKSLRNKHSGLYLTWTCGDKAGHTPKTERRHQQCLGQPKLLQQNITARCLMQ